MLVTGASGFVGGAVAGHLAGAGHEVVGLSRRPGSVPGLYGLLDANIGDTDVAARIARKLKPCDAIVHAAAALGFADDDSRLVLVNALGTQQMLVLAAHWSISRFVFLSSLPVIGTPAVLPVTEQHPTAPASAYHASKLYGEHLVAVATAEGRCGVSLRLTSPVGAGMPSGRILSVFVRRALAGEPLEVAGGGTRRQDYVDVRDVCSAVTSCLATQITGVVNVAAGRSVSNRELAERCVAELASQAEIRIGGGCEPEDDLRWEVSIDRALVALGWAPAHSLEASIRAVADGALSVRPSRARSGDRPAATS